MTLLALLFIILKLTNVRMWCLCVRHLACEKKSHMNLSFVFLSQYDCICVLSTSCVGSFMAIWLCSLSVKRLSCALVAGASITGHSRGPYLSDWIRALAFSFNGSAYSCRPVHLLLSLSVSNNAFVLWHLSCGWKPLRGDDSIFWLALRNEALKHALGEGRADLIVMLL